ncbi:MAG TPA: YfiR/HmsC family protein [Myxococcales bacterium]
MRRTLILAVILAAAGTAWAREPTVPVPLQMDLLAKVAVYDRNLPTRAGERVVALVVHKGGDDESARGAAQAMLALKGRTELGGLPFATEELAFTDAEALAKACRERKAALVYLAPGFTEAEAAQVGKQLEGLSVLTASADPSLVGKVVLGFDLVSGKPKLLVSLARAGKQSVSLSASVLKLMTVIE